MKWVTRLAITTFLSIAVAFGLSMVSRLDQTVSVFSTVKAQPVSESNIVDVVSKLQLHLRIRRVEVSHSIVSIDLSASKAAENTDIMKDLFEIPKGMFASSTNINQVLVRVLDASNEQGGSAQLLVASDARREKWLPNEPKLNPQSADELQEYLETHYRMTYTPRWQDRQKEKN